MMRGKTIAGMERFFLSPIFETLLELRLLLLQVAYYRAGEGLRER